MLISLFDLAALAASLWLAVWLRLGDVWPAAVWTDGWFLLLLVPAAGVGLFHFLGLYRSVLRSLSRHDLVRLARAVAVLALIMIAISYFDRQIFLPRSTPVIFGLVAFMLLAGLRYAIRLATLPRSVRAPVLIYGAGEGGIALATALDAGQDYDVVAFTDDDSSLHGRTIAGRPVLSPARIGALIERRMVRQAFLALPSASREQRKAVVEKLAAFPIKVRTIPSLDEIVNGYQPITSLRDVAVEELLHRPVVEPLVDLFAAVRGKSVLVTGAGGSIGSEICRQMLAAGPAKIVLFEMSEPALYEIDLELSKMAGPSGVRIAPVLGSVCDRRRLETTMREHGVQTVFHAAAYKQVPMVEANPVEGVRNNTLGAHVLAKAAEACGVERVTLISTDKAVRPTSVMGASKRMAELAFLLANTRGGRTVFSMVRFGNVMGSSCSVVPAFRKQIASGGPVTVTHPEVIRYFMTIAEAAQLVIQASGMADGGDVFLLDMGEPVGILDLARQMIHLSGLEVRSEANPGGDIAIAFTGLRPGEKLFEELLVNADHMPTAHPKIKRAMDAHAPDAAIAEALADLEDAVEHYDPVAVQAILAAMVESYRTDLIVPPSPPMKWPAGRSAPTSQLVQITV